MQIGPRDLGDFHLARRLFAPLAGGAPGNQGSRSRLAGKQRQLLENLTDAQGADSSR